EPLIQRLEIVGKHSAPALYNAAQMKRVPLKVLWWPLAKLQEGLGGKARFYTNAVVVLLAILVGVMIAGPYPLRVEGKGQMQPAEISKVYAPKEGTIYKILAQPGQRLHPDDPVADLFDAQLQTEQQKLMNELAIATGKYNGAKQILNETTQLTERLKLAI